MREVKFASAALGLIIGVLAAGPASAWDRRDKEVAVLADVPDQVEGITVGLGTAVNPTDNNIYAAVYGTDTTSARLLVIAEDGKILTNVSIQNASGTVKGYAGIRWG
jgi:hypothetical protein